jgi:hypothetical protein
LTWAWPLCSCREGGSARAWLTSCRSSELLTAHATRGRRADTPHVHGSALTLSPLVIKSHGQGGRGLVAIHFLFAQGRACLDQQRCRCGGGRGRGRRRRMRSTPMAAPRGRRTGQVHRLSARPLAAWQPRSGRGLSRAASAHILRAQLDAFQGPPSTRGVLSLWFSMGFQPACAVRCRSSHSDDHHHVPGMDGSASVARQVTFTLIDDTDGSPAAETVSFGLDGRQYVIDLSAAHAIQLRDVLASYLPAARRGSGSTSRRRSPSRPAGNREQTAAIRQWARANGQPVSDRGRISQAVLHAYENRDSVPAPVEIAAPTKKARKRSNKTAS